MCTSRSAGTLASRRSRNLRNSTARWRRCVWPNHRTGLDVERRKQRRGAVSSIVVGAPFGLAGLHRQQRHGAVEGLNLGTFRRRTAPPHGPGGLTYRPTMSRTFSISNGSGDSLKVSLRWGRKPEGAPDAIDGHAAEPGRARQRPRAPVRGPGRCRFQRGDDHLFDLRIGNGSRRPRAWLVQQPVYPVAHEAGAPLADGLVCCSRPRRRGRCEPRRANCGAVRDLFGRGRDARRTHSFVHFRELPILVETIGRHHRGTADENKKHELLDGKDVTPRC